MIIVAALHAGLSAGRVGDSRAGPFRRPTSRASWDLSDPGGAGGQGAADRSGPSGAGNAITPVFVEELRTGVSQLEGGVGCIAIAAEGETFCVGGDVRVFAEAPEPGASVHGRARP